MVLHFCCGWRYSYGPRARVRAQLHPRAVPGGPDAATARASSPQASPHPIQGYGRRGSAGGRQLRRHVDLPDVDHRDEAELTSVREQVIRLGKFLSRRAME